MKDNSKTKRRICIFCEIWASGGIESLFAEFLPRAAAFFELDVVAARIDKSVFRNKLEHVGVTFYELTGSTGNPKNYCKFKKLLETRRYDAIHFNLYHALSFVYINIARRKGVGKRIAHAHNSGLRKTPTRPLKMLVHRVARRLLAGSVTERLACSESAARFLFGDGRATVIKNGIDTERFRFSPETRNSVRASLGLRDERLLLHVGRLSREKNQEFLLGMHKELLKALPDAKLLLVGDGDDEKRLRQLANGLGIGASVIFFGSSTEVERLMCAADIFLFPSLFEGFGIAAAEAQCAGLPTLVSDGVPSDVFLTDLIERIPLSNGYGAWAHKAVKILNQPKVRTSRDGEIRRRGFTKENTFEQIIKFYF